MAIAQLTHLHLTIPSSGTTSELVPPECFPVVPLAKKSALSRRVSFARYVSIIDGGGAGVCIDASNTDLDTTERDNIQISTPTYVLFPGGDPFEDPFLPDICLLHRGLPQSFGRVRFRIQLSRHHCSLIPRHFPDGSYWSSQRPLGSQSSLSPIIYVHSEDSVGRLSSSSSVVSDDWDGDVGLLTSLLGLSSFDSMPRASVFSDISFYSAIDSPTELGPLFCSGV